MTRRAVHLALTVASLHAGVALGAPTHEAARGVVGVVEIDYPAGTLRARPIVDADAPVLVRVTPLEGGRHRIEYLGLRSGVHDLAPLIERADGRPAAGLPDLEVRVVSQLPETHGFDVFGARTPEARVRSSYWWWMGLLGAAWVLAPVVYLVRRAMRRSAQAPPPPIAAPPTIAERLLEIVKAARSRELTVEERGQLELLLLRALRDDGPDADVGASVAALRRDPRTAGIVLEVERWLHAGEHDDANAALAAIESKGLPA